MRTDYEVLQQRLGYEFGDRSILIQALTHTSYGHENLADKPMSQQNNERLEFLGDSILGVIVSDILLEMFPQACEGQLSKMRAGLVNEKSLAQISLSLHLSEFIRLGKGESRQGGRSKPSIISCTFEAMIAAIYLDGGFNAVYPVVRHLFTPFFEDDDQTLMMNTQDHKTRLQELVQAQFKKTPKYKLISSSGPDHAKVFEVEVKMGREALARAYGSSKKEAEQNAARVAIEVLVDDEIQYEEE